MLMLTPILGAKVPLSICGWCVEDMDMAHGGR